MAEEANIPGAPHEGPGGFGAVLEAMRPSHWVKNAFVVAPLLFSGRFTDLRSCGLSLTAFAAFCLLSSAVYLINDICDRQRDRAHPIKRRRPIASGRLSVGAAWAVAAVLAAAGFAIAAAMSLLTLDPGKPLGGAGLLTWTGGYFVLNLLYSFWLKNKVIVDVVVVAFGFVLRAMAGAAAIAVPVSPWLVVCTLTLCLFIAVTKRRSEVLDRPAEGAAASRAVIRVYTRRQMDHMLTVSTAMALLTYALYCLAPSTVGHFGSAHMVWTIPLVVYGMFRFNLLTDRGGMDDPVGVLLRDRIMWIVLALYVGMSALIVKFGGSPTFAGILGA